MTITIKTITTYALGDVLLTSNLAAFVLLFMAVCPRYRKPQVRANQFTVEIQRKCKANLLQGDIARCLDDLAQRIGLDENPFKKDLGKRAIAYFLDLNNVFTLDIHEIEQFFDPDPHLRIPMTRQTIEKVRPYWADCPQENRFGQFRSIARKYGSEDFVHECEALLGRINRYIDDLEREYHRPTGDAFVRVDITGHEQEMERFDAALLAIVTGREEARVFLVQGAKGSVKSSLVDSLQSRRTGTTFLRVECGARPRHSMEAFGVMKLLFEQAVRELAEQADREGILADEKWTEDMIRALIQHLSLQLVHRSRILARWYLGDTSGMEPGDLVEANWRFYQALSHRKPVVLCIDNIQWADEASSELFQHLAIQLHQERILFLATLGSYEELAEKDALRFQQLWQSIHDIYKDNYCHILLQPPAPSSALSLQGGLQALRTIARFTEQIWPLPAERVPQEQALVTTRGLGSRPKYAQYRYPLGSKVCLGVEVEREGYLLLLDEGPEEKVYCLCPSWFAPDNHLQPGVIYLPQPGARYESFVVTGCPGRENLLAIISDEPLGMNWLPADPQEPAYVPTLGDIEALLARLRELDGNSWVVLATYFDVIT